MNELIQPFRDDLSAYFSKCEECGQLKPDEMVSLVLVDGVETEMCQECHAIARENGKDVVPI
jgi:hypothetical protein